MNLYRDGQFVETFDHDRDFNILIDFLLAYAEPIGASSSPSTTAEQEESTAIIPVESLPAEIHQIDETLVVQRPRGEENPSGEVISLTSETFDNFVAHAPAFVKFFAPWYKCSSVADCAFLKFLFY